MKIAKTIFFIVFLCVSFSTNPLFAKSVVSTGTGITCEAAQKSALRNAVEQVAGVKLKSNTSITNFQVDYDKIFSSTDGLINSFRKLDVQSRNGSCEVVLKVDVNEDSLEQQIDKYISSKKSMRTFTQQNFAGRSVVVLYSTRKLPEALSKRDIAVLSIIDDIQDKLRGYEFDVVLEENIEGAGKSRLGDNAIDDKAAIEIARMAKADAVVLVTLMAGKKPTSDGYNIIFSNVLIKAYDPTTKRLFANVNEKSKTIGRQGNYGLSDSLARGACKASKVAIPKLIKKIVQNLSTGSMKVVKLTLQYVSPDRQDNIEDILSDAGIDYKVDKQAGSIMVLRINTDMNATEFNRFFRKLCKKQGVHLKRMSTDGADIIYSGR